MEAITDFVDGISSYDITIPVWAKIALIVVIIIALCGTAYFMSDYFNLAYMRSGMAWFIFVAVINFNYRLLFILNESYFRILTYVLISTTLIYFLRSIDNTF